MATNLYFMTLCWLVNFHMKAYVPWYYSVYRMIANHEIEQLYFHRPLCEIHTDKMRCPFYSVQTPSLQ